jgi:hypothetical protein
MPLPLLLRRLSTSQPLSKTAAVLLLPFNAPEWIYGTIFSPKGQGKIFIAALRQISLKKAPLPGQRVL